MRCQIFKSAVANKATALFSSSFPILPRFRHSLPIPKLPLILGIPRFLAFLFVAIRLPIAPADEVFSAVAAAHHNANHAFVIPGSMFLHRVICHHVGKGEPSNVKDGLYIHGEHYASRSGTEFEPQPKIGDTLHQQISELLVIIKRLRGVFSCM